ncbi:MAG TPA: M20/M25/M40 family metallo-hydrolase [Humisphaera sp.]|jgi:hypothetical protein|nr:M20/M25/M40 family metallo-hydrolase [Humisphaera sp.]
MNRSCRAIGFTIVIILNLALLSTTAQAQRRGGRGQGAAAAPADPLALPVAPPTTQSDDPIMRIRDEGLNHSQVMATLSYLTDVIGPRLTGSPNLHRANEWTRDKLTSWGLENAHLEAWGPFGRGWSVKRFSMQVIEPQSITLISYPKAWSPGFDKPLEGEVVYVNANSEADLEKYAGKVKGAIVLMGAPRPVRAHFDAPGVRMTDSDLLVYADNNGATIAPAVQPTRGRGELIQPARGPATQPGARGQFGGGLQAGRLLGFLAKEGAAVVVNASPNGDGGTIFVQSAAVPGPAGPRGNAGPRVWAPDAPAIPPQIVMAAEDYNRLVRMIEAGEKLKVSVDLQVQFSDADLNAYNTIAEIPGTDLKDELVMLGGHMDSWHSGTGATDNGAGVAVAMEAVRILEAQHIKPRRTIRIALWTGEEEGMLGSAAYMKQHFGSFPETGGNRGGGGRGRGTTQPTTRPAAQLIKGPEYDKFSAYFNLDNGTGRIRGVFLQNNEAVRPLFRRWLTPFRDMGATTLSLANTGSTDHVSFDDIGLPGFQFIQDPVEYMTRTHHSNEDVFDRIQEDDVKQASVIMAGFIYQAAMADEKVPRKPLAPRGGGRNFQRGGQGPATQPVTSAGGGTPVEN